MPSEMVSSGHGRLEACVVCRSNQTDDQTKRSTPLWSYTLVNATEQKEEICKIFKQRKMAARYPSSLFGIAGDFVGTDWNQSVGRQEVSVQYIGGPCVAVHSFRRCRPHHL